MRLNLIFVLLLFLSLPALDLQQARKMSEPKKKKKKLLAWLEIEINDSNRRASAEILSWVAGNRASESLRLLFFKRQNKQLTVKCT